MGLEGADLDFFSAAALPGAVLDFLLVATGVGAGAAGAGLPAVRALRRGAETSLILGVA